jgi:hypothetical protein
MPSMRAHRPEPLSEVLARASVEPEPVNEPVEPHPGLRLQRTAGNRATSGTLDAPLRVGAADDPAERQADELADRVLRRLSPSLPGAGIPADVHRSGRSGPLAGEFDADAGVAERIRARSGRGTALPTQVRRSMEEGFGTGLGDVRIHTDGEAARLSDALGAEAFTHGRDVFFGAGRFDPQGGQHLLAHELAHVVQARSGAHRSVRRKLKGTRTAVLAMGGKPSTRQRLGGSDYPRILGKLEDYEARESKVVAKRAFAKGDREWMTKTLHDVLGLIDSWTTKHDTEDKHKAHEQAHWRAAGDAYVEAKATNDLDGMIAAEDRAGGDEERRRISALRMLRPRVAYERSELLDPGYFNSAARTDDTVRQGGWTKDNAVGGAMNRLDKVEYADGKQGFFIKDKASAAEGADVAGASGIDAYDPNQGARSVASSRLAKLFGAKEITGIEFATHESKTRYKDRDDAAATTKMGVFSEKAEGSEAYDHKLARSEQEKSEYGPGATTIDMNDPELQRGLNVLQMLDYLSRQLDRHMHNVYIATDEQGRVLGVTGIDLDLSFGAAGNNGGDLAPSGHFVGIPQLADATFRAKVLSVTPQEVRACLDGLLLPAEVDATIERFTHLRKVLSEMDPKKVVQAGGWGADTAKQQMDSSSSYLGKMADTTLYGVYDGAADKALGALSGAGMNAEKRKVGEAVKGLVYGGQLSAGQGLGLLDALVQDLLTDPLLASKRAMQAGFSGDERKAANAVRVLQDAKKQLTESGATAEDARMARVEAQIMAAEVEKQSISVLKQAADMEYDAAVALVVSTLSDFAVRIASRQKRALPPGRRPARV